MKKFWMLLLCLMMALATGVALADEAPAELLGEWDIVSITGDAIGEDAAEILEMIKALGGSMTIEFTNDSMIMRAKLLGETTEEPMPCTFEDGKVVMDGEAVPYTLDGNTLTIADASACMVLQRVGTVAETDATEGEPVVVTWEEGSILGPWDVVEFFGDEDAAQSMELIKSMGGSVTVTFTETEMTLAMSFFGETMEEVTPYVIVDNTIVAEDGEPVVFVLDGTTLTIGSEDEAGMLLQRPDVVNAAPVEPTETPVDDGTIIGEWVMVDMTGSDDATEMWAMMKAMGASIEMTITEDTVTMVSTVFGESETESFGYTIEGNKLVDETGYPTEFTLENGRLTLLDAGMGMVFERK